MTLKSEKSSVNTKDPLPSANLVSVYPNPVSDLLMIETENNNPNTILLYDVLGNICLEKTFANKAVINVSEFLHGVYFYELRNDKKTLRFGKFLRQ